MAEIDWNDIKTEYITTRTSYRKLAAKYGIGTGTLEKRATKEKWVEAKKKHYAKSVAKALRKAENAEAKRLARIGELAGKALDVAMGAFNDDKQFNKYLVERRDKYAVPDMEDDDDGESVRAVTERQWVEEQTFTKVDTKALKDLTNVIKDLTGIVRNVYGIPTQGESEAQRIASERLDLDKRKEDAGIGADKELEIVFAAGPEEWNE